MSDKMERWDFTDRDFTDNENDCDAMVLSEDGEFVEYEVVIRRIRELEQERDEAYARGVRDGVDRIRLLLGEIRQIEDADRLIRERMENER